MSEPLESRIARMVEVIDRDHPKVTVDELNGMLVDQKPRTAVRRSRFSGPLVAVASTVVVLLLVGGVAMLTSGFEQTPSADSAADLDTWFRIPQNETVFGGSGHQQMLSVTNGGPGLVAVGSDNDAAAVWTSTDGTAWSRVPHDEAVFGGAEMRSVTAGDSGLVAVGLFGSTYVGDWNAAVWTSVDGTTWSRVPHDSAVFGEAEMKSVTVGGPGFVAVGQGGVGWIDEIGYGRQDAVVWTSVDGTTWSRVAANEAVFGGEGIQSMVSVTAGGPGLVAVGGDDSDAAVWTSLDGITWSQAPHDEAVLSGGGRRSMLSVTAGGPGLVAVGSVNSDAAVWTSPDGIKWSRLVIGHENMLRMTSVTVGGPGLVAVGFERLGTTLPQPAGISDARDLAAVWVSVDGIEWSRVPHEESVFDAAYNQQMLSVTVWELGLVAVGSNSASPGWELPRVEDAAVWLWKRS